MEHDFSYRFQAAGVSAILCTADGDTAHHVDIAEADAGMKLTKIMVGRQPGRLARFQCGIRPVFPPLYAQG